MNKAIKLITIIALASSLAGCGTIHKGKFTIFTSNKPVPVPIVQPAPMNLAQVEWKTYDLSKLKVLVTELELTGQSDTVFYVMDKQSFDVLAMNLSEMKRYITDQGDVNKQLREAIAINAGDGAKAPDKAAK